MSQQIVLAVCSVVLLLVFCALGWFTFLVKSRLLKKTRNEIIEFHNDFVKFADSVYGSSQQDSMQYLQGLMGLDSAPRLNQQDQVLLHKLLGAVDDIQLKLGPQGVVSGYKIQGMMVSDYPILLNTVVKLRTGNFHPHELIHATDACVRRAGVLDKKVEAIHASARNMFSCLREGIKRIIAFIFVDVLQGFGFLSPQRAERWTDSGLLNLLASMVAFIGFASSIVTIATAITPVKAWMHSIWPGLF